jgi:palmitoyl-protein thioesterase
LFGKFEDQVVDLCRLFNEDPTFHGEFNVVGISQGGLYARYLVSMFRELKGIPRNYVSLGTPHMGVTKLPYMHRGPLSWIVNGLVKMGVYSYFVLENIVPAAYFRIPTNMLKYMDRCFLAKLNNEEYIDKFINLKISRLNRMFLGMFEKDQKVYPKESAIFGYPEIDGSVLSIKEVDLYKEDWMGLKNLDEQGRIIWHKYPGKHMEVTLDEIDKTIIPVLKD